LGESGDGFSSSYFYRLFLDEAFGCFQDAEAARKCTERQGFGKFVVEYSQDSIT
jgi:hypothetical protein